MRNSSDSRGPRGRLPATDLRPRPGDFPVGSLESRAAARAILGEGGLEVGTSGFTEEGHFYRIIPGSDGQPVKMIWDIPRPSRERCPAAPAG